MQTRQSRPEALRPLEKPEPGTGRRMTVAETAAHLRVSVSTVRGYLRDGTLKGYRIGPKARLILIYESDINSLITPIHS